jgi:hypothetical protein
MLLKTHESEHYCPEKAPDIPVAVSVGGRPAPSSSDPPSCRRFVNRRPEPRYPTMDVVEVCILKSDCERVMGTVLDVTRTRLRVEVAAPISNGASLEIVLRNRAIICGVTRYCRRSEVGYHVGLVIKDIYYAQSISAGHPHDDQLGLYLAGKGLTVMEVIHIRNHLLACMACLKRLSETEAISRQTRSPME